MSLDTTSTHPRISLRKEPARWRPGTLLVLLKKRKRSEKIVSETVSSGVNVSGFGQLTRWVACWESLEELRRGDDTRLAESEESFPDQRDRFSYTFAL